MKKISKHEVFIKSNTSRTRIFRGTVNGGGFMTFIMKPPQKQPALVRMLDLSPQRRGRCCSEVMAGILSEIASIAIP
jgi:hypothetical protein